MPDLTGDERHAPEHSSTHGVQATLPKERVTASCWNTTPFIAPVTSAWDIRLESEQTQTLMIGLCPRAMEDRVVRLRPGPGRWRPDLGEHASKLDGDKGSAT
jgi:hypothetical protein